MVRASCDFQLPDIQPSFVFLKPIRVCIHIHCCVWTFMPAYSYPYLHVHIYIYVCLHSGNHHRSQHYGRVFAFLCVKVRTTCVYIYRLVPYEANLLQALLQGPLQPTIVWSMIQYPILPYTSDVFRNDFGNCSGLHIYWTV